MEQLIAMGTHLGFNLFFTIVVVFAVYARNHGRNEYVFTYMMFNLVTFLLCFTFQSIEIDLAFAFGLFAVFGILRYRTETIPIQELTYLFIVIGLAILNALAGDNMGLPVLLAANIGIVVVTAILEQVTWLSGGQTLRIIYDDIDKLRGDQDALKKELGERTGSTVERVIVNRIDLLRDTADLTLYVGKSDGGTHGGENRSS